MGETTSAPARKLGPNRGNAGKGRPKGSVNKTTANVKAAFEAAFEGIGGVPALVNWARSEPSEFYKLYSKLLPHQVTGEDGGPVQVSVIKRVVVNAP